MPELWGKSADGANRKLRELWMRDNAATNRKMKELWAKSTDGANRKIFSSAVTWKYTLADVGWESYSQIGDTFTFIGYLQEGNKGYTATITFTFAEQLTLHVGDTITLSGQAYREFELFVKLGNTQIIDTYSQNNFTDTYALTADTTISQIIVSAKNNSTGDNNTKFTVTVGSRDLSNFALTNRCTSMP